MSRLNEPAAAATPAVLSPYHGAQESGAQRTLRRLVVPLLVLFCLLYGVTFALIGPFMPRFMPLPLLVLGAVLIWALPETDTAPTRSLEVLFFAFLLGLILWPNYLAVALPGMPWITVLRLVGIPMAITLLICVSVSQSFRSTITAALKWTPWLWRPLVAFAILQVISMGFSSKLFFSFQKLLNAEVNWTAIFFASCYVFMRPGRARLWVMLLCLTTIPIYLIAFKEFADQQLPWADHIPGFLKVQDESVQRILAGAHREEGEYRVQSTFSTPLGLGEYAALVLPFLLYLVAGPYRLIVRLGAALMVPVTFQVVLLSDSRLGLFGCMFSIVMFVGIWGAFLWRRSQRSIFGPAIVVGYPALVTVVFLATIFVGRIRNRFWGSGQYDDSNKARQEMYDTGIPMILHHPHGYGVGMGAETLGFTNAAGVLTIDTYYMLIGLEYGVIGFLLYYGMILAGVYYSGRQALSVKDMKSEYLICIPLGISLLNFFIIKSVFSNDDNHPLVFMMLGMIVALIARARSGEVNQPSA
jgi:hypothetical protein